jgi:hypothetical protein
VEWQLPVTLLLVLAATVYLVRLSWRTWTGKGKGCGGRCQCGNAAESQDDSTRGTLIPVEKLTLRLRRQ